MAFSDYYASTALNTTIGEGIYIGPNMARNDVRDALQQLAADGRGLFDFAVNIAVAGAGRYNTKAAVTAALGGIAEGSYVEVLADESVGGDRTLYQKVDGALVFRTNYSTAVSAQSAAEAARAEAEALVADVSAALAAGTVSDLVGTRVYASKALLQADLVPADNEYALVVGDATAANNDLYQKNGATTTGSWDGPLGLFASASAVATAAAAAATDTLADVNAALANVIVSSAYNWLHRIKRDDGTYKLPAYQSNFQRERYWLSGAEVAEAAALTANGDGSWSLPTAAITALSTATATNGGTGTLVVIDYVNPTLYTAANKPSGTVFSWHQTSGSGSRFEVQINQAQNEVTVPPGGIHNAQVAFNSYTSGGFAGSANFAGAAEGTQRNQGITRQVIYVPTSGNIKGIRNDGYMATGAAVTARAAPNRIEIGRRSIAADALLANCTVLNIAIYDGNFTDAEVRQAARANEYDLAPLFFYGDSLNNAGQPDAAFRAEAYAMGYSYIPTHSDGTGGRGFSYHKDYLTAIVAAHPHYASSRLVMIEGGLDYSSLDYATGLVTQGPYSERDIEQYLRDIRALFTEPKWVLMAPHLNKVVTDQNTETTTVAVTDSYAVGRSNATGSTQTYYVFNDGPAPMEYKVSVGTPSGNGVWVSSGASSTVSVANGSTIYIKNTRTGDAASVRIVRSDKIFLVQQQISQANMRATWPEAWLEWQPTLQKEADTDAEYLLHRANFTTPTKFLEAGAGDVHVNWHISATKGGYFYMVKNLLPRLLP